MICKENNASLGKKYWKSQLSLDAQGRTCFTNLQSCSNSFKAGFYYSGNLSW